MASVLSSDRYRAFAEALRAARLKSGVTQSELAKRLAKPQSYVSKIECFERRVDPAEFHDWLAALNLDATALFSEIVRRNPS